MCVCMCMYMMHTHTDSIGRCIGKIRLKEHRKNTLYMNMYMCIYIYICLPMSDGRKGASGNDKKKLFRHKVFGQNLCGEIVLTNDD